MDGDVAAPRQHPSTVGVVLYRVHRLGINPSGYTGEGFPYFPLGSNSR
jgi:hypothetical protein